MENKKIDENEIENWFNIDQFEMSKIYLNNKIKNIINYLMSENNLAGLKFLHKSIIELEIKFKMHELP